ncbi:MAG TPA: replicative DNA helicase [Clostridiales bacterium]|nr:replicative DNA helicase [Clostridiales bacterium]
MGLEIGGYEKTPYSAEAEQAVIGSMLIDPGCIPEALEAVSAEDFYIPENASIFETIHSMFTYGRKIDPVLVLEELKIRGVYDEAGGRAYLYKIMEATPSSANVQAYAEIVKNKAILRHLAQITGEVHSRALGEDGKASDLLELAEQKMYTIRADQSRQGLVPIHKIILDSLDELNELARHGKGMLGVPSGFSELDYYISGLNRTDLILLAARPGVGKTSIALNIAQHVAVKSKKDVAIFNLEMPRSQLVMRLLSSEAAIDLKKLRTADMSEEEWDRLALAAQTLSNAPIYVDDSSTITVAEMKARCRRLKNLGLIVVDYLQLMSTGRRDGNRVQEISEISRSMKIMAKELDVPVICLSQLSRAPEKREGDKRPMLSDLRDSGAIEQDADIVIFLYKDENYNPDTQDKNVCECIVAKNRNGQVGTVKLQWQGQFTRFTTREHVHHEP